VNRTRVLWFAAFTAVFAVLAAFVFWGTWSPDVAPVMPDDGVWHPLAFSDQFADWFRGWLASGVFVPVDVFFRPVIASLYWLQELKYVAGLFFAALGLVFFLRGRGLSRLASYGAGLLLAFCGYWMTLFSAGHAGWFMLMASIIPAFAFLDRAVVTGRVRYGVLTGACVGWGSCNQPDLFYLFSLFLAAYGIYACVRERTLPWKPALAALVFFGVIGAPGIRSAFKDALATRNEQIAELKGAALAGGKGSGSESATDAEKAKADAEARWIFVTNWSMPPEDTLEFVRASVRGDTSCPMTLQLARAAGKDVKPYTGRLGRPLGAPSGNYRQHSLYVGWVTCLLALLALVAGVRKGVRRETRDVNGDVRREARDVIFFAVAALVFWLFSMGRYCEPVYRVVYQLPFGDYLRAPVKWHHLTEFCLVALAGFGIDALLGFLRARGCGERIAFALVALLVVFGATDLARNDRLFCAPIDLTVVRGRNAAADEVVRRGRGTVCDLVAGGGGLLSWSFNARGIGTVRELTAPDVRFVWTPLELLKRNPQLTAWLKKNATLVGLHLVTSRGIFGAAQDRADVALYQMNGVPPPPPPVRPPVDPARLALGLLSLAGTLAAGVCAASFVVPRRQTETAAV